MTLTFAALRIANIARIPEFRDRLGRLCHPPVEGKPPGHDWTLSQWSNAVCGELGEAANLIKKIERGDFTIEQVRRELGRELADVVTYLDILAHRAGVDLGAATAAKFNEVSARVNSSVRVAPNGDIVNVFDEVLHQLEALGVSRAPVVGCSDCSGSGVCPYGSVAPCWKCYPEARPLQELPDETEGVRHVR